MIRAILVIVLLAGCAQTSPSDTGGSATADGDGPGVARDPSGGALPDADGAPSPAAGPMRSYRLSIDGSVSALALRFDVEVPVATDCSLQEAVAHDTDRQGVTALFTSTLPWREASFRVGNEAPDDVLVPNVAVEATALGRWASQGIGEGNNTYAAWSHWDFSGVKGNGSLSWYTVDLAPWPADATDGNAFLVDFACDEPFFINTTSSSRMVEIVTPTRGDDAIAVGVAGSYATAMTQGVEIDTPVAGAFAFTGDGWGSIVGPEGEVSRPPLAAAGSLLELHGPAGEYVIELHGTGRMAGVWYGLEPGLLPVVQEQRDDGS